MGRWWVAVVMAAVVALAGCATPQETALLPPVDVNGVRVQVAATEQIGGVRVAVLGAAQNMRETDMASVFLFVEVVDDAGVKLANGVAFTQHVGAHQVWRFRATLDQPISAYTPIRIGKVRAQIR